MSKTELLVFDPPNVVLFEDEKKNWDHPLLLFFS